MKNKSLSPILICFTAIALFNLGFTRERFQPATGTVEGYVFPKEAKTKVVVIVPHPQDPSDTLHRVAFAHPNTGYFKIHNVPAGQREILYYPKDPTAYRSKRNVVTVISGQTVSAATVTLQPQ